MYVEWVKLINFRNYVNQKVKFVNGINIFTGGNAQGKTNILEALYISAIGKSFRQTRDADMVFFGEKGYFIEIELVKRNKTYKIEVGFDYRKGKKIKVGGIELNRIGEVLGNLVVVVFTPDDLEMVKEGPYYRRRFLDILISQLCPLYLFDLQQYNKVLEHRNRLLKQIKDGIGKVDTLEIWDSKLEEIGSRIVLKRYQVIEKIKNHIRKIHKRLTSGKEELEVFYKSSFLEGGMDNSYNIIREHFKATLQKNREIDVRQGVTNVGPHRDDICFLINGLDPVKFGSQGQQKTVVISVKLAEVKILQEEIQENPVLLLDDVFSELDEERREFLKRNIGDLQVFITDTGQAVEEFNRFNRNDIKIFRITEGKVIEI